MIPAWDNDDLELRVLARDLTHTLVWVYSLYWEIVIADSAATFKVPFGRKSSIKVYGYWRGQSRNRYQARS